MDLVTIITQTEFTLHKDEKSKLYLENNKIDHRRDQLSAVAQLKGSLEFIKLLEGWIVKKVEKFCLKLKDIKLFDDQLIITTQQQIEKVMEGNHPNISYNDRIRTLIGYINFRVRNFLEVLEARQKQAVGSTDKKYQQYMKLGTDFLASYFAQWLIVDIIAFYREIFNNKSNFKTVKNKKYDRTFIAEYSLSVLGEGEVEREDLAPLCYLKYLLDGFNHITKFEHIVVDEAQDLNAMEFTVLRLLSRNSSFTIMGDMSQGINSYRSIDSWQFLMKDVFFDVKSIYREVNYSYRSAREIVECFNSVMPSGHSLAIPVYEIGHRPVMEQVFTNQDAFLMIVEAIKKFTRLECKSIGIITKLARESQLIYEALHSDLFAIDHINLITSETVTYQGGISILPVTLAKGLEFDGVIIWNASDKDFRDNNFDHKLLYVALSRALYYLHILYRGNLTPLLKNYKG